jgi:hypothetical protein
MIAFHLAIHRHSINNTAYRPTNFLNLKQLFSYSAEAKLILGESCNSEIIESRATKFKLINFEKIPMLDRSYCFICDYMLDCNMIVYL